MEKTWNMAAERWLSGRTNRKGYGQEVGYVSRLTEYLDGKPLKAISKGLVSDIRDGLLKTRQPPTVNRHMTVLRSVLTTARDEWEWIDVVPQIKRMEEEPPRERYLTKDEAKRLIEALPPQLRDKVILALSTGMRDANVRGLRWDEVDLKERLISIPAGRMKANKPVVIPLNDDAYDMLLRRHRSSAKNPEWVFSWNGKAVLRSNTRAFRTALAKAGISDFRWHDLRHTWASWHVQAGTHTAAVRELGGWSDDRMVKRYAHLSTEHLRSSVGNIGKL